MLFCSNFNGTWDQYIDAFSDGIPGGLDLFWYSSTKYPHSIPITPFKELHPANQIDTNYYYNATPGLGAARHQGGAARAARDPARWRPSTRRCRRPIRRSLSRPRWSRSRTISARRAMRRSPASTPTRRIAPTTSRPAIRPPEARRRTRSADRGCRDAELRWRPLLPDRAGADRTDIVRATGPP